MRRVAIVAIALVGLMLSWTVWPTPYRYDQLRRGVITVLVRTNRFTGRTMILDPRGKGWVDATYYSPDNPFAGR